MIPCGNVFYSSSKKEKVMYELTWKGEVIENDLSLEKALYLLGEYNLEYNGGVILSKQK